MFLCFHNADFTSTPLKIIRQSFHFLFHGPVFVSPLLQKRLHLCEGQRSFSDLKRIMSQWVPQRFIKKMQLENGPNGNDRKWKRWTTTLQVIVRMTWRRRGEEKGGSMRMRRRRRGSKGKISTMSSTNSRSPSVSWSYLLFTLYFCSAYKTESLPDGQVQTLRCVFRSVQLLHGLEHFAQRICSRRTAGPLLFNQVRFVVGLSPQLLKPWEHKRKSRVLFCAFAGVFCFVVVQRGASVSQTWVCAWRAYTNDRQYLLARPRTPSWIPCPES